METKKILTESEVNSYTERLITLLAKKAEIDISVYDMKEMVMGMLVELEHGSQNPKTDVTGDDPLATFKIMIAHLDEIKDYYTRLTKMEKQAEESNDKTEEKPEESAEENKEPEEKEDKEVKTEGIARRNKELCGLLENDNRKQLKNIDYQDNAPLDKKIVPALIKEEIDPNKFKITKFEKDDFGKKETEEEKDLYKMEKK